VRSSPPPCAPSFPARTLRALHARTCDLVEAYWDAAFAAEWARVEPRVDAAARAGERLVAAAGVHALLGLLRPRLTVDRAGGVATLRCGVDELEPGEEEHVIECSFRDAPEVALYPSFFSWPHVWMGVDPGWPAGITLPIHMLAGADRPRVPPDDLARLLRACGDDVRLRILRLLAECPRRPCLATCARSTRRGSSPPVARATGCSTVCAPSASPRCPTRCSAISDSMRRARRPPSPRPAGHDRRASHALPLAQLDAPDLAGRRPWRADRRTTRRG
jgi:DNA-binding transcriptional ArsR family regulator